MDLTLKIRRLRSYIAYSLAQDHTELWSSRATCARIREEEEPGKTQCWTEPLPPWEPHPALVLWVPTVAHPFLCLKSFQSSIPSRRTLLWWECKVQPSISATPSIPLPNSLPIWSLLGARAWHQEGPSNPSFDIWGTWVPEKLLTCLPAHTVSNEPGRRCRPGNPIPASSHPFTNQPESIYSAPATYKCQGVTRGILLHLQRAYHLCSLILSFTSSFITSLGSRNQMRKRQSL